MQLEFLTSPFAGLHGMRELGGPIVIWIFISCVVMWTLALERFWYFKRILPKESAELLAEWQARPNHTSWTSHQVRKSMISRLNSAMKTNVQVMKVLVPMCPLLGLVGTVSGMLNVFDSMAALGSADARSMATGVSEAMICTLSGLAVSISGLYPAHYFTQLIRVETERLSEQFTYA